MPYKTNYSILENIPHIVLVFDRDGTIEYINYTLPGFDRNNVIGKKVYDFIHPDSHRIQKEMTEKAFDTGEIGRFEIKGSGAMEEEAWYETYIAPLKKDGKIVAVTQVSTDITERKKAEGALKNKTIALRELVNQVEYEKEKVKSDVARNVDEILLPMVRKLDLKEGSSKYLDLLQRHLEDLTSSFGREITRKTRKLTPKEIELCSLIKGGLSNKEIARLLNLSIQTIERHRKNIRKKLGISTQNVNLTSYLQQL